MILRHWFYLSCCSLLLACFPLPTETTSPTPPTTRSEPRPPTPTTSTSSSQNHPLQQLLVLVNQLRSEGCRCGSQKMPPVGLLRWDSRLDKAAERHARDMARRRFFDHTGSDGSDVAKRVKQAGFTWQAVAENIAHGQRSPRQVFDSWRKSPGHCKNMMNARYTHMGAAESQTYWVQTLARPRGS